MFIIRIRFRTRKRSRLRFIIPPGRIIDDGAADDTRTKERTTKERTKEGVFGLDIEGGKSTQVRKWPTKKKKKARGDGGGGEGETGDHYLPDSVGGQQMYFLDMEHFRPTIT